MANAFHYSIGKKFIQAVSGAFLVFFLLLHGTINFFSVIDTFTGKFGVAAKDEALFSAGDGLFKHGCDFMSLSIVDIMVPILALGFVIHIGYGIYLTVLNLRARGGVKRYEASQKAAADSWSAKNMFVLGLVILGFLCFHLSHFWAKMQLPELFGVGNFENNPYLLLTTTFGNYWILAAYIIWFVAIWLHLNHGFWSMFQTVGWNGSVWFKRLKVIAVVVSTLIVILFLTTAVNACLQAHGLIG